MTWDHSSSSDENHLMMQGAKGPWWKNAASLLSFPTDNSALIGRAQVEAHHPLLGVLGIRPEPERMFAQREMAAK